MDTTTPNGAKRFELSTRISARGRGFWWRARDAKSGASVLAVVIERAAKEREAYLEAQRALASHPAFAFPLGIEDLGADLLVAFEDSPGPELGAMSADELEPVAVELLDLLAQAHRRDSVHPGIDAPAVSLRRDDERVRVQLRGLGLPSDATRRPSHDMVDLGRHLRRLLRPGHAVDDPLARVLERAVSPDDRFIDADHMLATLLPLDIERRVTDLNLLRGLRRLNGPFA